MKRILALILALALVCALAACAKQPAADDGQGGTSQTPGGETGGDNTPDEPNTPADGETPDSETPDGETPDGENPVETGKVDPATAGLDEIMTAILDGVELPAVDQFVPDDELFSSYLFIDPVEGADVLVSEAMINAVAHSVALLRVPEGTDAASIADQIRENANPRKWVCVEAEKTEVVQQGNLILLCMSFEDTCDAIVANFNALFA